MSEKLTSLFHGLTPGQLAYVDRVCLEFEQACQTGDDLSVERFLGDSAEPVRSFLLRELLVLEREYRSRPNGQTTVSVAAPVGPSTISFAPSADNDPSWPRIDGYEIESVLGRGAMGKVFKARQSKLGGRTVALKVILSGQTAEAEELERFRLEAMALAKLNNPHIIHVHEVGEWRTGATRPLPFFSMEFVAGGTLARRLAKTPQPPCDAATMMIPLARAVHAAHHRGIVHRDLKPGNILLAVSTEEREARDIKDIPLGELTPKISDFGLAKEMDAPAELTQTGRLLGTPSYMAPEQASGRIRDIGPATDVYALGVILYEMLTGRPPFTSAEAGQPAILEILEQVRSQEPIAPSRLVVRLPRDLETICLKCLQKEPAKRYVSARSFAEDLELFLAGKPIQARPVGRIERTWRWCRRNRAVAALTAGMFVSLVLMTYLWRDAVNKSAYFEKQDREIKNQMRLLAKERDRQPPPAPGQVMVPVRPSQKHAVELEQGKRYHCEMTSDTLHCHLSLEKGTRLDLESDEAHDEKRVGFFFDAKSTGTYWLTASSLGNEQEGPYTISVQEFRANTDTSQVIDGRLERKHKVYVRKMDAGHLYRLDLASKHFDAYLVIENSFGKKLAENDDNDSDTDARLHFRPTVTDQYRVVVSAVEGEGRGAYTLSIVDMEKIGAPTVFGGELRRKE